MKLNAILSRRRRMGVMMMVWVLVLSACAPSIGQDNGINTEVDIAYMGKYVWRGLVANPDPVIQPSLTVSWDSGLSLNLWGSMDTTDVAGAKGKFTEIDYTLNYDWRSAGTNLSAGIIYYHFPNTGAPSTTELYVTLGLGGESDTTLSLFWDIDEAQGAYISLSSGRSVAVGSNSLDITGSLGLGSSRYNDAYFGRSEWALVDATLAAEMPISSRENWSVTPALVFSTLLDSSLRSVVDEPDNFLVGVTASACF